MKEYRNLILMGIVCYILAHYFTAKPFKIYTSVAFLIAMLIILGYSLYKQPNKSQNIESNKVQFISVFIVAIILGVYFIVVNQ
jgi:hypothetical protein